MCDLHLVEDDFRHTIMSTLMGLPTELVVLILAKCSIKSAVVLSGVNRRLRCLWIEHSAAIIQEILEPSTPAYQAAVDFTYLEVRLARVRLFSVLSI